MMAAESPDEFAELVAEGNQILERRPNHCLITTSTFEEVEGAKLVSAKDLAFAIIEAFQIAAADDDVISTEREAEAAGLEDIVLALLWASEQGMLREIRLVDVPESTMMSQGEAHGGRSPPHNRRDSRGKRGRPGRGEREHGNDGGLLTKHGRPPQSFSGRSRLGPPEEGNREVDPQDHGTNSARTVHVSLHRADERRAHDDGVHDEPDDEQNTSEGHQPHTVRDTGLGRNLLRRRLPQDAVKWFPLPGPQQSKPGRVHHIHVPPGDSRPWIKGKWGNELLREYLGMDVDEATLEFYMKQGFYTPNTPHDLRVQLQTALDMLELLTCDGTIAGKGLAYVLDARRWGQLTTVLNDRFKSETDFGAKFCYALDRHLQTFFNKVTRWEDIATEGQSRYLTNKAEELIERLEDGQGLNVVLPVALSATSTTADKTKRVGTVATGDKAAKKKKPTAIASPSVVRDAVAHSNTAPVAAWQLPEGIDYLDLFGTKMPGLKGWPVLLDTRISERLNKTQKAPITSIDMPDSARETATARFKVVYNA
ncbi:hypothetical protein MHU86_19773 [Fragilaria crotonensis]|nr:hypothetical protein MHU86_19773 [Fragilaria crotonensis]